ncbi:hypothetical protein KGY73_05505 [bacterium]|nr:hypothetical protein [bacterium]
METYRELKVFVDNPHYQKQRKENTPSGQRFFDRLKEIISLDPQNVQFGCAQWFWERQVNSYVLQVEPDRFKDKDKAILDYKEALYIEKIRNEFFRWLEKFIEIQGNKFSFIS